MNIHVNWRGLIVVTVLGVIIASGIRTLQGWPRAEFTADEKAMMEGLAPVLDTLVLHEDDLSSLPDYYEPCEGGKAYGLQFGNQGDSPDVEDIRPVESYDAPVAYSSFCGVDSRAYVSSTVALPYDKEHLTFLTAVYLKLTQSESVDALRELVEATSRDLQAHEEVVDYIWLEAPTLGETRFAWARDVRNVDTDERFEVYDFKFTRGVVLAVLSVEVPRSPNAEDEARAVAQAFDGRIAAELVSLAAEVHAQ